MYEKILRTCRYGHGNLISLSEVKNTGELLALAVVGMKFTLDPPSTKGERLISGAPEENEGYIVQMYKCPTCGYLEMEDLTGDEIKRLIQDKEAKDAVERN